MNKQALRWQLLVFVLPLVAYLVWTHWDFWRGPNNLHQVWWNGLHPLKCYGKQELRYKGSPRIQASWWNYPEDAALTSMGHCSVVLDQPHLVARTPIIAEDGSVVTVHGGEIGCVGLGPCISVIGHARVELDGTTVIVRPAKGHTPDDGVAIDLSGQATLVMKGGKVDAWGGTAVQASDSSSIDLDDATLTSSAVADKWHNMWGTGLSVKDTARAEVTGGALKGGLLALWDESRAPVTLVKTAVKGHWHVWPAGKVTGLPR